MSTAAKTQQSPSARRHQTPLIHRGADCINGMVRNRKSARLKEGRREIKMKQVLEVQKSEVHDREEEKEKEKQRRRWRNAANVVAAEGPPAFDLPIRM